MVLRASELRLLRSVVASNVGRLRHPYKVSYAVTYRCNLRCRMCSIWKKEGGEELSVADVDRFFARAPNFSWVGFTGGEPFLRSDLGEIVEAVVSRCRHLDAVHFNTNGRLAETVLDVLGGIRRRHPALRVVLTVSLDGPPAVHDRIRGREGTWDLAMETFLRARGVGGVKAQLGYTLSADNLGCFDEALEAVRRRHPGFRFDDLNVNVFQRSDFYYDNHEAEAPDGEALRREIGAILERDREGFTVNNFLRRRYLRLYLRFLESERCPLPCRALSATCFLDPAGDLYPCTIWRRRLASAREMDVDLGDLWRSPEAERLRQEIRSERCPSCWSPCDAFSSIAGSAVRAVVS